MKSGTARNLPGISFWVVLTISAAQLLGILVLLVLNLHGQPSEIRSFLVFALIYVIVSLVILKSQPGNRIGLILAAIGMLYMLGVLTAEYEVYARLVPSGNLPLLGVARRISGLWFLPMVLLELLLMVFPSGHLLSQRWKWLAWLAGLIGLLNILIPAMPQTNYHITELLANILIVALFVSLPISAVPLVRRYRRSRGVERQQIKWFAFAGCLVGVGVVVINFISEAMPLVLQQVVGAVLLASPPVAIAIAVLRFHLWDIDLIIRRTLQYGLLTGLLALVYFGSVVLLQNTFETLTGQRSPIVVVVSTLGIAALFNPLRLRVQRFIDRRFYRRKYDAEQTLAEFAAIARDEVDLDILTQELIGVMEKTIKPEYVSVWLKPVEE